MKNDRAVKEKQCLKILNRLACPDPGIESSAIFVLGELKDVLRQHKVMYPGIDRSNKNAHFAWLSTLGRLRNCIRILQEFEKD
jgi:hypothetical protein